MAFLGSWDKTNLKLLMMVVVEVVEVIILTAQKMTIG